MSKIVSSPGIKDAELLVSRSIYLRPYVWPFTIIYPIFFQLYWNHYDTYFVGREWTFVYTIAIVSLNLLFWLMPHWNIDISAQFNYSKVDKIEDATYIKITPAPNSGIGEISPINRETFHDGEKQTSFLYQKRRYLYHPELKRFLHQSLNLIHYQSCKCIKLQKV